MNPSGTGVFIRYVIFSFCKINPNTYSLKPITLIRPKLMYERLVGPQEKCFSYYLIVYLRNRVYLYTSWHGEVQPIHGLCTL